MINTILYLFLITSFFPVIDFSIDLGFFQLSIFRVITIIVICMSFFIAIKQRHECFSIIRSMNIYAISFHSVWLLYAILTVFWIKDYSHWFKSVYFLGLSLFSIIFFNYFFKEKKQIKVAMILITIILVINSVIGIYEVFSSNYFFLSNELVSDYSYKHLPVSWFNNTNDFAMLMLIGFNLCLFCKNLFTNKVIRIFFLIDGSLMISLIFLAGSRANVFGLAISVILLICFYIIKRAKKQIFDLAIIMMLAILSLFVLNQMGLYRQGTSITSTVSGVYQMISTPAEVGEQSGTTQQTITIHENIDESINTRINLIKNGLYFLYRTYGFGVGSGNIEYWMENYAIFPINTINMHNWWFEILTAYGVLILIGYLIFYGRIILHAMVIAFTYPLDSRESQLSIITICIMGGLIFGLISSSSNFGSEWLCVFMAVLSSLSIIIKPKFRVDANFFEKIAIRFSYLGQMRDLEQ